jgi:hypothetical protein
MPSEPDAIAAQSDRMSPKILPVHIELRRLPDDLHGGVIDIEMAEFDIRELRGVELNDLLTPKHAGLQHIRLVHGTDLPFSRAGQFESGPRHAANLIGGVLLGVEAAALPIGERFDAPRFSEIDAAGKFADDDEVDIPEHTGLERRRIGQSRVGDDGPEVGVKIVFTAQRQQASRLARRGRNLLRLGAAGCAPKDRVGFIHRLDGFLRQHLAGREVGNQAVLRLAQDHRNAAFGREPVEHAMGLRRDFRADALAADHRHLDHVGQIVHADFLAKWIHGRSARSAA